MANGRLLLIRPLPGTELEVAMGEVGGGFLLDDLGVKSSSGDGPSAAPWLEIRP